MVTFDTKHYVFQAHSFKGEALLSEDKCGEAIKSLQEAEKCKLVVVNCISCSYIELEFSS